MGVDVVVEKKSMGGGEMGFQLLVRPHHSLQFDVFQPCMTTSNGH